jgi:hypothetical protein
MDYPDYIFRATRAEANAAKASSSELAREWRQLADTYRALAHQRTLMERRFPSFATRPARQTDRHNGANSGDISGGGIVNG